MAKRERPPAPWSVARQGPVFRSRAFVPLERTMRAFPWLKPKAAGSSRHHQGRKHGTDHWRGSVRDGLRLGEGGAIARLEIQVAETNGTLLPSKLIWLRLGRATCLERPGWTAIWLLATMCSRLHQSSVEHAGPATVSNIWHHSFGHVVPDATLHVDNLPPRLLDVEAVLAPLKRPIHRHRRLRQSWCGRCTSRLA